MLNAEEKQKTECRHLMLALVDGPDLQRGRPTGNLAQMYAAVPLAQEFAEKCGGFLQSVSFGKFVGNIGIWIPGGLSQVRRDLEEYRLLADAADDMDIDTFEDETEIHYIFWDIYTVEDTRGKTFPAAPIKVKKRRK